MLIAGPLGISIWEPRRELLVPYSTISDLKISGVFFSDGLYTVATNDRVGIYSNYYGNKLHLLAEAELEDCHCFHVYDDKIVTGHEESLKLWKGWEGRKYGKQEKSPFSIKIR